MKPLTLKQLREAIYVIGKGRVSKFKGCQVALLQLQAAENVLLGLDVDEMPRDPREVLTEIGYKW